MRDPETVRTLFPERGAIVKRLYVIKQNKKKHMIARKGKHAIK